MPLRLPDLPHSSSPPMAFGVGVEQDFLGVETVASGGLRGSVQAKAVFDLGWIQADDGHGVDVAGAEGIQEWDFDQRRLGAFFEEHQAA